MNTENLAPGERVNPAVLQEQSNGQALPVIETVCCSLLSIDAWRDADSWTWNNWFHIGKVPVTMADMKPRALLRELRARGILTAGSAGQLACEDDGYNVVVIKRSTREPLLAVAYGEVTP